LPKAEAVRLKIIKVKSKQPDGGAFEGEDVKAEQLALAFTSFMSEG
jgi:hypothetical protein